MFSDTFDQWLLNFKDLKTRSRIIARLDNIQEGHLGDYKPLGEGLLEFRLHFGSGYRIYFIFKGTAIIFLLAAGNKDSQVKDIAAARAMME